MHLELMVWGSREWSEQVQPLLAAHGFVELPQRHWADPETDGERMRFAYTYRAHQPLAWAQLAELVAQVETILATAEAPLESIMLCADTPGRAHHEP
jgi:hypothetical protein